MAYLTDDVRRRPNLTIMGGAEVDSVVFDGRRATGVRLVNGETIAAGQVILSAGTFGSPAILMRSGIGPASHLQELGIPVSVDAPVGERLKEHPFYYNVYALKPEAKSMTPAAGAIIWTNSSEAGPGELDLHISGTHIFDPAQSPTGGAIVLACAVTLPKSIGSVRLASRDPRAMPLIRYNFFQDPSDLRRMMEAVRLSRRIGRTAPFSDMVEFEMTPGKDVEDDAALEKAVIASVDGYSHPTSTVRWEAPTIRRRRRCEWRGTRRRRPACRRRLDHARHCFGADERDDDHDRGSHQPEAMTSASPPLDHFFQAIVRAPLFGTRSAVDSPLCRLHPSSANNECTDNSGLNSFYFHGQYVPDPSFGHNDLRAVGAALDLASQSHNQHVNAAIEYIMIVVPCRSHKVFARKRLQREIRERPSAGRIPL